MEGVRPVCALAPGVMGETGFEVAELTASLLRGGEFASVIADCALAGPLDDPAGPHDPAFGQRHFPRVGGA